MKYATTPETSEMTGLSVETLREWTNRRALIPADIPPRSKGSPAQYAWQTVLILRLAVSLRNRFHLELQAHKTLFGELKEFLRSRKPSDLKDATLVLFGDGRWALVDEAVRGQLEEEALSIRLRPYLEPLLAAFGLVDDSPIVQIELFPMEDFAVKRKNPVSTEGRELNREVVA
jgi:hypothetical protein